MVVAVYTPMELLATTFLAVIFLDEDLQLRQFLGAGGILFGLAGNILSLIPDHCFLLA